LARKAEAYAGVVKVGRTHLQDATPVTPRPGDRRLGRAARLLPRASCASAVPGLLRARDRRHRGGHGAQRPSRVRRPRCARKMAEETGRPFVSAPNKFAALAAHDALVTASASLAHARRRADEDRETTCAGWPPGPAAASARSRSRKTSPARRFMPGKVNPTQSEALTMVCVQVFGNDTAVAFGRLAGQLRAERLQAVMVHNVLESIQLLADASRAFRRALRGRHRAEHRGASRRTCARNLHARHGPSTGTSATTGPPRSRRRPTRRAPTCARRRSAWAT
jgi:fumarate hydratase class II